MHVAFPKDTFDKLVNYLGSKPFNEVENLINELKATIQPVTITAPEPPKEEGDAENHVQSNEPEITQSETATEGGQQDQGEEPQVSQQQGENETGVLGE